MNKNTLKVYGNLAVAKLKKNSPKILVGVGIASGIAAIAYAIKVSMNVEPIIDTHNEAIDEIKEYRDAGSDNDNNEYTENDYKKDLTSIYLHTAGYFAKLYAPTAVFEAIAITSICAGFGILDKRYVTAVAAFASTYTEFSEYRNRVADKYGEEAEYDIYNNIVEETVETKGEDGKKKKDKVKVIKNEKPGSFIFFLGKDYCKYWDYRNTDEQNLAEMKVRLAGAISNSNRDVLNNGYMYLDKLVDRLGVNQRDAYRQVAIKYNPDFGNDQISVSNNIKIRDNHITEGGEKVITVEVKGFEPFSIDKWDPIEDFLKIKVNN